MALTDLTLKGLHCLDPERAHELTLLGLRLGLYPRPRIANPDILHQRLWDLNFPNPFGIAAGFDKNALVPRQILHMGFGFAEVGTVTPKPQPGNPRPRLFRLPDDRAVINRNGFNSDGAETAFARLRALAPRPGVIGLNLGANKDSADRIADYEWGVRHSAGLADYYVINISSPNTPGLRDLQSAAAIRELLQRVLAARNEQPAARPTPVLVKIAPDLTAMDLGDIAEAVLALKIDGVIISNTTVGGRAGLKSANRGEQGGLSGAPLFAPSTEILRQFHRLTGGAVPLIGVGGIDSPETAYGKVKAGASLLQLYTALTYQGPGLLTRLVGGLAELLRRDGFAAFADAVGCEA